MSAFRQKGGFGNGGRFGSPKRFGGKPGGFRQDRGEMFDAVCADCGARFQLPFRPAEGRPVYCRECFPDHAPERDVEPQGRASRPFRSGPRMEQPFVSRAASAHDAVVAKQLEMVNEKLDRLIAILEKEQHRRNVHEVVAAVTAKTPAEAAPKKTRTAAKKK